MKEKQKLQLISRQNRENYKNYETEKILSANTVQTLHEIVEL